MYFSTISVAVTDWYICTIIQPDYCIHRTIIGLKTTISRCRIQSIQTTNKSLRHGKLPINQHSSSYIVNCKRGVVKMKTSLHDMTGLMIMSLVVIVGGALRLMVCLP